MNIKYELNEESYKKLLLKKCYAKEKKYKIQILRVIIFIAINLLPIIAIMKINFFCVVFFIVSCIVFYRFPIIYRNTYEKIILKRFFYPGFEKEFIEKCSLTVTNKCISYYNNWIFQEFKWENLKEFKDDSEYVYLEFTNREIIIKRAAFKTEEEIEDFIKIIKLCRAIIGGVYND